MLLLHEFPHRYFAVSDAAVGSIDDLTWLTPERAGGGSDAVPAGAAVFVRGWAPNVDVTASASHVVVTVDGKQKHFARVGGSRSDVARHFDSDAFAASGFEAVVTTGRLAPGEHKVEAFTVDLTGKRYARLAATRTFVVKADWTALPGASEGETIDGAIEGVTDESRGILLTAVAGTVPVPRGARLSIDGWFGDPSGARQVADVFVLVDGDRAYPAEYGTPRPDVAASYGTSVSTNVGFRAAVPTAGLTRGTHTLQIAGRLSSGGLVTTRAPFLLTVGQSMSARLPLDETTSAFVDDIVRVRASAGLDLPAAPLRLNKGDQLFVRGWAVDDSARSAASGVAFVIDGRFEVSALYGLPRPDVATTFKNPAFARSGFTAEIDTESFEPGLHNVECRVFSRDGRGAFKTAQSFVFEVIGP